MDIRTYKNQDLKALWSSKSYDKYQFAQWGLLDYPFEFWNTRMKTQSLNLNVNERNGNSILEIGSAMGRGYEFLLSKMSINPKNFTGIEISSTGVNYCEQKYPQANWIHADFSSYEFTKNYDFTYERHAIHHMPEPLEQFKKIFNHTNYAFCSTFRGCIEQGTISNLNLARFAVNNTGVFYLNIISVPDLVALAIDCGFNQIRVIYRGLHEKIPSDILKEGESGWFLDQSVASNRTLIYTQLYAARITDSNSSVELCYPDGFAGIKLKLKQANQFKKLKKMLSLIPN